jgi:hypothetical protein
MRGLQREARSERYQFPRNTWHHCRENILAQNESMIQAKVLESGWMIEHWPGVGVMADYCISHGQLVQWVEQQ